MILLVDIQSFYASVEKAHNPDLKNRPVVVSGDPNRRSGVILAACPIAKSYGIKNAETLWEAMKACPEVVVVKPRMELYLQISLQITAVLERFTDLVEPYSIDEQFLDVTGSERLFGSAEEISKKIQQAIYEEAHVYARVGIGPNKVLSKMACDNFAKKNKQGIFRLDQTNIKETLWTLPVSSCFGVGRRMTRNLQRIGITTIGELAQYPLEKLQKHWGINGHVLWMTANGMDLSPVTLSSFSKQKAIGHHMTLPRDYRTAEEIEVILLELCEEVCRRVRRQHLAGITIHVGCRGADFDIPTGFSRQQKLPQSQNETMPVYHAAKQLFHQYWDGAPIRSVGVSLGGLSPESPMQLDLFADRSKQRALGAVVDELKDRYGSTAILHAASLTSAGQALERAKKIGGHYR
ncbi:DNA polymerase IV [Shimazuella alba]|uniref:DNA polymerase IV n=1 Tax=Shimazuella alba TaxID=2690964 RepID=A0A6I4VTH8_9BACL|nr:DNA polymerase IV [Shimazuella alba]MXQ53801.1 DNA polymerase IV [Shimazuella alba]